MEKIGRLNTSFTDPRINLVVIAEDAMWRVDFEPRRASLNEEHLRELQQRVLNESKYAFSLNLSGQRLGMILVNRNTLRRCPEQVDICRVTEWITEALFSTEP